VHAHGQHHGSSKPLKGGTPLLRGGNRTPGILRGKSSWEEIDAANWRKEGDDPAYGAIESFFDYLNHKSR